jgi:lipooligosaccharide transport system permease protein
VAMPPLVRVVEREVRIYRTMWRGFAFTTFVTPVLFLGAMGIGLGSLVNAHTGSVNGFDYLDFIAPGLLVASAMQVACAEALWPVLGGVKWMQYYFGIVATPIKPGEVFGGYVTWIALRAMLASVAFLLIAALLGAIPSWWGVLAIPVAALCAAAFCAPLAAFSITQDTDLAFPMIMRLGVLPLFLFSGTFFPVSQLPSGLQHLAWLSPLWHAVELARAATTGQFDFWPDVAHVAFLVACIAIGAWFGVRNFTRRLSA